MGAISVNDAPAKNVWVYAFSETLNCGNGAYSDENGSYTITGLTINGDTDPYTTGYIVSVHNIFNDDLSQNPVFTYQAYDNVSNKNDATLVHTGSTKINFNLKTQCSLSGTVKDIYGIGIPDVDITVKSESTGYKTSGKTDRYGKYTIVGLTPLKDFIVAAFPMNYPSQYYKEQLIKGNATHVDMTKGDVSDINFICDKGFIVQGIIYIDTVENIAPPGLWVNIWSDSTASGGEVPTDIYGKYQITGLDPHTNDYVISMIIKGYLPAFYNENGDSG